MALIPECDLVFDHRRVDPRVGLFSSFTMAVTIAIVGGRPAMISTATGAIALVVAPLARQYGLDHLVAAVLLCGVFQIPAQRSGGRTVDAVHSAQRQRSASSTPWQSWIFTSQLPHLLGVPAIYWGCPRWCFRSWPSA